MQAPKPSLLGSITGVCWSWGAAGGAGRGTWDEMKGVAAKGELCSSPRPFLKALREGGGILKADNVPG